MDFYIYGYIILFIVICGIIGYMNFSKEKPISLKIGHTINRGGLNSVPGMRTNFSKKHKKKIY